MARVELAATPIGLSLPGLQAYHTSILINGIEFSFCDRGVVRTKGAQSHEPFSEDSSGLAIVDFGVHEVSLEEFELKLAPFFRRGTYDLLAKNCNSFSFCALFYLTGQRLDDRYAYLESLGRQADQYLGFVQALTGG